MGEPRHTKEELKYFQSLPLDLKVRLTQDRIRAWVNYFGEDGVVVAFSGGKDSTVLLHLVRELFPNVKAAFSNTGLEYPEIRQFAMKHDNVDVVYPGISFKDVLTNYGYPLISKETSEAIYYARRIRHTHTHNSVAKTLQIPNEQNVSLATSERKRSELQGERVMKNAFGRDTFQEEETYKARWFNYPKGTRRRHELHGFKVKVTENTFEEAAPSQFNKERFLPIARELPVKISHYCCAKLKKLPMKKYQRENGFKPILGTMAEESRVREQGWLRTGCNAFDSKEQKSQPLSFWTNQDILQYIAQNDIEICSVYGDIVAVDEDGMTYAPTALLGGYGKLKCTGCDRTGCIYCAFGFHNERGETRFQRLAKTHPKQYEFALGGGQWADNPDYDPTAPKFDGDWENWNPKKIWIPGNGGLGLKKVFDLTNEIMGKDFYRYD